MSSVAEESSSFAVVFPLCEKVRTVSRHGGLISFSIVMDTAEGSGGSCRSVALCSSLRWQALPGAGGGKGQVSPSRNSCHEVSTIYTIQYRCNPLATRCVYFSPSTANVKGRITRRTDQTPSTASRASHSLMSRGLPLSMHPMGIVRRTSSSDCFSIINIQSASRLAPVCSLAQACGSCIGQPVEL
ncbi:hypothetical protein T440DRAFT_149408 [Plenodomus tracheiphilus IPT5]|uniref:Uncharacterized protein n=1 Tax=Plenodomus tracheiphilus IPT5 TaxID=1408161 RepID=A0A6A7B014_9PLEO|nr:hypothetical protein T440DRAFT_149408 [Plenodomus tracheiphilus IPT5]